MPEQFAYPFSVAFTAFRARVANWVRESSRAAPPPEDGDEEEAPRTKKGHKSRLGDGEGYPKSRGRDGEGAGYAAYDVGEGRPKGGRAKCGRARGSPQLWEDEDEPEEVHAVAHVSRGGAAAAGNGGTLGQILDNEEKDEDKTSSASGSEANMDASSAAGTADVDADELTSDWR